MRSELGFAAGDPTCGRRSASGHVCGAGLAEIIAEALAMEDVPTQMPFRFDDLSDACLYFAPGNDQPFAVATVGSRPMDGPGLRAQLGAYESCETVPVELGEEGHANLCVAGDEKALSFVWWGTRVERGEPQRFGDRFSLESCRRTDCHRSSSPRRSTAPTQISTVLSWTCTWTSARRSRTRPVFPHSSRPSPSRLTRRDHLAAVSRCYPGASGRGGRVVEGNGLENRQGCKLFWWVRIPPLLFFFRQR